MVLSNSRKIGDVDDDGTMTCFCISLHRTSDLNEASAEALLTGSMLDETSFEGSDTVKIVPKCK
jgi:hypothetical protein